MENFYIFVKALDFIEIHLCDDITQDEIALHCRCSVSTLQKIWKFCTHQGIMHYIKRRRLTLAARELRFGAPVLATAVKYGYGSNEAFTRAFRTLWGVSPTDFARTRSFTGIYPRMGDEMMNGGLFMKVKFDLTELYDKLRDKKGTYIVCFDIKNLMPINAISRDLGDEVIKACVRRIDAALEPEMLAFRIGGDEFAVVTGSSDIADAQRIEQTVTAGNDEVVTCGADTAVAYLHSGIMRFEDTEGDFFDRFDAAVVRKA